MATIKNNGHKILEVDSKEFFADPIAALRELEQVEQAEIRDASGRLMFTVASHQDDLDLTIE